MKTLLANKLKTLSVLGLQYSPNPAVLSYPAVQVAFCAPELESPQLIAELYFTGFNDLESDGELLDRLSTHAGRPVKFAVLGTGAIILQPELFNMGGQDGFDADEELAFSDADYDELTALVERVFKGFFQLATVSAIGIPTRKGSLVVTATYVMLHFFVAAETTAEVWQCMFQLKAQELTAASAYHNKLVGLVGQTTTEDIAVSRILN